MTDVTLSATAAAERAGPAGLDGGNPPAAARSGDPCAVGEVLIADHQAAVPLEPLHYRALVRRVLEAEAVPAGAHIAVTFVEPDEMATLNETYMGEAGPTDVLAFPIDFAEREHESPTASSESSAAEAPLGTALGSDVWVGGLLVGDVVVCPAVAAANASAGKGSRDGHDGSVVAEIDLLVVHGLLHLLGMDHREPDETVAMRARENEHLRAWWGAS